tara:strand:- start:160184 stop:160867 length:684 start_codon:yes stop_codon:yes gene_type:complete
MSGYETDEQQWDAVKGWFNKNGSMISWVVIIAAVLFMSGRYYLHHNDVIAEQGSEHYFAMISSQEKNDTKSMLSKANRLIDDYPKTPYAQLAAFTIAKYAVEEKNYDEAEKQLKWVMNDSTDNDFKMLARVRLIKTYYAKGDFEKALSLHNKDEADGWLTLMEEIKGDILHSQSKLDEAVESYEAALEAAPEEHLHGQLLTYKLKELGMSQDLIDQIEEKKAKVGSE